MMLVARAVVARAISAAWVLLIRLALKRAPLSASMRLRLWMRLRVELARWK